MANNVGKIEKGVGLERNLNVLSNISKDVFETAGEMFISLNFCPELVLQMADWIFFFDMILDENIPLSTSILILNRLINTDKVEKDLKRVAYTVLDRLRKSLPLQHRNIEHLTEVKYVIFKNLFHAIGNR